MIPSLAINDDEIAIPDGEGKPKTGPSGVTGNPSSNPLRVTSDYKAQGIASWYGEESGKRTASGEIFQPMGLTAAHKTLPLASKVRVTNVLNGRYVDVVINDRGPFKGNRLIDLSRGAARHIGMKGLAEVVVESLAG